MPRYFDGGVVNPGLDIFQRDLNNQELQNAFQPMEQTPEIPFRPEPQTQPMPARSPAMSAERPMTDEEFQASFAPGTGVVESGQLTENELNQIRGQEGLSPNEPDALQGLASLQKSLQSNRPQELPETRYQSFSVDDGNTEVRDSMSERRRALMEMLGRG